MSWIEVRLTFEPGLDLSPFIDLYGDFGIENTLEDGATLVGCLPDVEGAEERISQLAESLRLAGALDLSWGPLPDDDWEYAWKQFFHATRVGRRFVVCPSWEQPEPAPDDLMIVLDPGQAFGTGDHPTTRLCLQLMERLPVAGRRVLDLGCGTGILSIAASRMGAADVTAVDIDPIAVEVAKENAANNGVHFSVSVSDGLGALDGKWDTVLSNIISATLIRLAHEVRAVVAAGGYWLVSGIIADNWPEVLGAAERAGFHLVESQVESDWVAAVFEA